MRAVMPQQTAEKLKRHTALPHGLVMRGDILAESGKSAESGDGKWRIDDHGVSIGPDAAMRKFPMKTHAAITR